MLTDNSTFKFLNFKYHKYWGKCFLTTITYKVTNLELSFYFTNLRSRQSRNNSNSITDIGPKHDYSCPTVIVNQIFENWIRWRSNVEKWEKTDFWMCNVTLWKSHVRGRDISGFQTSFILFTSLYHLSLKALAIVDIHDSFHH